jgi:hypothetical protein
MITQLKFVIETVCLLSVTILIFKYLLHETPTAWETSELYIFVSRCNKRNAAISGFSCGVNDFGALLTQRRMVVRY